MLTSESILASPGMEGSLKSLLDGFRRPLPAES